MSDWAGFWIGLGLVVLGVNLATGLDHIASAMAR